jgi:hypothetical protein
MNSRTKIVSLIFAVLIIGITSCTKDNYAMGDIKSPTELVFAATIAGKTAGAPNGDGSGKVTFTFSAKDALVYKVDFGDGSPVESYSSPTTVTKTYQKIGTNNYKVNVTVSGTGGVSTTTIKAIDVFFAYDINPAIIKNLTNNASKAWVVDKSVPDHFGVGPWEGSVTPSWWSAGVDEKVASAPAFYTASFTFTQVSAFIYTLEVKSPDGILTKTGALAGGLPGIPATGAEGVYPYAGGTSGFSFVPASSGISAGTPSTQASILLEGVNTFVGYGAVKKEYEILTISSTAMYLRVRGTETGNAWYLKLKPAL